MINRDIIFNNLDEINSQGIIVLQAGDRDCETPISYNYTDTIVGVHADHLLPKVVYFRINADHSHCVSFLAKIQFCEFLFCHDWANLSNLLQQDPRAIIVHHTTIVDRGNTVDEFVMMLETMLKYLHCRTDIKIGVVIDRSVDLKFIKKLQRVQLITGIVPSVYDFSEEESLIALNSIVAGVSYWPKHIIDQYSVKKKVKSPNEITLTQRQQEILDLIADRGITNKQIAKILKISESTVKIHVSAIMRAYCVRNRTQLALSIKK